MFYDKRRMLAMSAFWDEAVSRSSVMHQESSHLGSAHGCANFSGGVGARVSLTWGAGVVSGRQHYRRAQGEGGDVGEHPLRPLWRAYQQPTWAFPDSQTFN